MTKFIAKFLGFAWCFKFFAAVFEFPYLVFQILVLKAERYYFRLKLEKLDKRLNNLLECRDSTVNVSRDVHDSPVPPNVELTGRGTES